MGDFATIVIAIGRGIIKLLISTLVGFGMAILLIGLTTAGHPEVWEGRGPPGELLIGIGAGLLSGGATLLGLFLIPWLKRPQPAPAPARGFDEAHGERPSPRPRPARDVADTKAPPVVLPHATPVTPPVVLPATQAPSPEEADRGSFYAK